MPVRVLSLVRALVLAALVAVAACGDDGGATRPPATQPPATQPPVTQPPATQPPATQPPATGEDLPARLVAAIVAGDRAAAERIATPNVVDFLAPWEPLPGASLSGGGSPLFLVTLGIDDVIECTIGSGLVRACERLEFPSTENAIEFESLYGVEFAENVIVRELTVSPGGAVVIASGAVVRAERIVYLLQAGGSEVLLPAITSLENNAAFDVYAPDGELLAQERTAGPVLLPEPGRYQIVVGGTRGNATYDLAVALVPAQTVRFAVGTSGTTLIGDAAPGESRAYVLGAAAGQMMELASADAKVTVYSPTGAVLAAGATDPAVELPEDGDYVVVAEANGSFELAVTIR